MPAIDTISNNINYLFDTNWKCLKTLTTLRYTNTISSLDEYIIDVTANDNQYNVSIPLGYVNYKTSFCNLNDAINYLKMHIYTK